MHDNFLAHGAETIEKVRQEKPDQYLKVVAMILPKEFHMKEASFEDMSDEELMDIIELARSFTASIGNAAVDDEPAH